MPVVRVSQSKLFSAVADNPLFVLTADSKAYNRRFTDNMRFDGRPAVDLTRVTEP